MLSINHRKTESFKQKLRNGWIKRKQKGLGIAWNKNSKGVCKPNKGSFYIGFKHSEETKKKFALRRGEHTGNWKGGVTSKNTLIRNSNKYKNWRESVFKRDNYTCQFCGKCGGKIQADHIAPFATYPELRFSLDNGRTLCIDCHKKTPNYLKNIKKL